MVDEQRFRWFDLLEDRETFLDPQGVIKIHQYPGLWIDTGALIAKDHCKLMSTLQSGIASAEHSAFVQRLAQA